MWCLDRFGRVFVYFLSILVEKDKFRAGGGAAGNYVNNEESGIWVLLQNAIRLLDFPVGIGRLGIARPNAFAGVGSDDRTA